MMPGFNQGQLIGYVGSEPKYSIVGNKDTQLLKIAVGTSDWYKGQQSPTQWHDICVWGDYADTLKDRIHTGQLVFVVYTIRYSFSQPPGDSGKKRKDVQLWASSVQVLADQKGSGKQGSGNEEPPY
jgi:single-stranded DNA-binding protein